MPDTLPFITPKPAKEVPVPDNVSKMTFSVDDFEVEQLPEQGKEEVVATTDKTSTGEKKETKVEKAPEQKTTVKEDKQDDSGAKEQPEQTDEKKEESGIPKYLKPPKTEVKDGKETQEVKPGQAKPIVPPTKVSRDFTGFSKEEADAGRQMSNEAFEIYKKAILSNKELSTLKEKSYLEHPQAYILSPEFQEVRTSLTYAQKEAGYWEDQLAKMTESGADLVPLQGWDAKTGNPIFGQPIKATKALEERVRIMIGNCYREAQNLQGKLQEFPTKYQTAISQDIKGIEDFQKQQFGWEQDPKLMDYSIPVEGLGDRTLKQIKQDVFDMIPKWAHSHPLAKLTANLVIALRCKQAEMMSLTSEQQVAKTQEKEQEHVEPSSRSKPSSAGSSLEEVHGVKEFRIDPDIM